MPLQVRDVQASQDNSKIVSVGGDKQARPCSLKAGNTQTERPFHCAALVAVGPTRSAVRGCPQVFLWDVGTGRTIRKFRGHDRCGSQR